MVDHQIVFGNATKKQVAELFERVYANDSSPELNSVQPSAASSNQEPSYQEQIPPCAQILGRSVQYRL